MSAIGQTGAVRQTERLETFVFASARDCHNSEEVFARELRRDVSFDFFFFSKSRLSGTGIAIEETTRG
jgi:hypothetical protein